MLSWWKLLGLAVALLVVIGCRNTPPNLKPPPEPDIWNLPPQDEARFSKPVSYPQSVLHEDPFAKRKNRMLGLGQGQPGGGMAPRPGGLGMR